jgi:hypothetical protein
MGNLEIDKRSFLKLSFANKGIDGINLGNILHHKSVKSKIPPYLKDQSVPIVSLDGIHKYFKVVFPVYGFRLTIFRPFGELIS